MTASSGIVLENVSGDPLEKTAIPESIGQGAAAIDYDDDGLLDLYVVNGGVFPGTAPRAEQRPALYRNLGDFRFADVTAEAGLLFDAWGHGASVVDFDADGHDDLYVTVFRGPNRFFRNRGDGTFEAAARWGGADTGPSTAAVFFDADADGDLDLYVGNYVDYDPDDPPNDGAPCEWRGLMTFCGPLGTTPAADTFYVNREGTLVEATDAFGFGAPEPSYALGAIAGDIDDDGDPDLYVANDSRANFLFLNQGGGSFREAAAELGVDRNENGREQAGMGVDLGDVDNDGRLDIFVTNFSHDNNTLYRNFLAPGGRTLFEDATNAMKLGIESYRYLSWGTRIVDLDHDGWQDIVIVSGHVYPQVDRLPVGTTYSQRNQIFENLGTAEGGTVGFREVLTGRGDAFSSVKLSRGLVVADLDNDGDADCLVVEMDAPPSLIRNDTAEQGHWIGFELRGTAPNLDAIGARVVVRDSQGVQRLRERSSGGSYLSTGDPRLLFGLGSAGGAIREVAVRWPSGRIATYANLEVDRYWLLDASSTEARPP